MFQRRPLENLASVLTSGSGRKVSVKGKEKVEKVEKLERKERAKGQGEKGEKGTRSVANVDIVSTCIKNISIIILFVCSPAFAEQGARPGELGAYVSVLRFCCSF